MSATTPLLILGIESSCDDTAASVLRWQPGEPPEILSSIVSSQDEAHADFGGVVPEIAARSHAERLDGVTTMALDQAGVAATDLDLIAATAGPGLIGGVMAGLSFAKGLALAASCPLIPVNHLAGHAHSPGLTEDVTWPYLLLLVSGGHTQLLTVEGPTSFKRLGTTIDDAAGEAFDKTAKLLGLSGAGGPAIDRLAREAPPERLPLPRPLAGREGCDFSFSGLKTAVRILIDDNPPHTEADKAIIAASFQDTVSQHLISRTERAMQAGSHEGTIKTLVTAGGVAANSQLRSALSSLCEESGWHLVLPPLQYCTDNAAMIAYAGALAWAEDGQRAKKQEALGFTPRPRWPLDDDANAVHRRVGKRGRKA